MVENSSLFSIALQVHSWVVVWRCYVGSAFLLVALEIAP